MRRNLRDPAAVLGVIGGLAGAVFFITLLVDDDPPFWIFVPAFVLYTVGWIGELLWGYRRGHRKPTTRDPV